MAGSPLTYTDHPASQPGAPVWAVTLADGSTVPMAVDQQHLDAAGGVYAPAGAPPPTMADSGATAGPGGGVDLSLVAPQPPPSLSLVAPPGAPSPAPGGGPYTLAPPGAAAPPEPAPPVPVQPRDTSPVGQGFAAAEAQGAPPAAPASPRTRVNANGGAPGAPAAKPTDDTSIWMRQGGGSATKVPAEWQPGSRRTDVTPVSEEARKELANASINQALQRQAETEPAARDQLIASRREELQAQEEQRQIDADKVRRGHMDDHLEQLQRTYQQRMAEVPGIDPGKFYKDAGALGTILAAITVGLGAQSQALLGGGPNTAKELLDGAIQRSMDAQKQETENALARGEAAHNAWADALQMYGSPELADKDFRARATAVNDKLAHAYAVRAGVPEIQQGYDRWHADQQVQRAHEDAAMAQAAQAHVVETSQYRPEHLVGGGGGQSTVERARAMVRESGLAPTSKEGLALMDHLLGGPGWRGGQVGGSAGLTPTEQRLGLSEPAGARTGLGKRVAAAGEGQDVAIRAYTLAEEYRRANLEANADPTNLAKRQHAAAIAREARGTYRKLNDTNTESGVKESEEQFPFGGVHPSPAANATINAGADALAQKALANVNAGLITSGAKPMSMQEFQAMAGGLPAGTDLQPEK